MLLFKENATVKAQLKTSVEPAGGFCNFQNLVCRMGKYKTTIVYLQLYNQYVTFPEIL